MKGSFAHEEMRVLYSSKLVPILAIKDLLQEMKEKKAAKEMMITEEDIPNLESVVRQTKILLRSEEIGLVTADARKLVQIGLLLK